MHVALNTDILGTVAVHGHWRYSVKFKKPPVVEAWIEFRFALTQETSAWDESAATVLVEKHFQGFKPESFSKFTQIEVDAKTGTPNITGAQEFFDRIRAFSSDRDRCVQAGRDRLVFNQLNKGEWPGYEAMRDGAMEAVARFMRFRSLDELVAVALHYRDVVSIPRTPGSGIRPENWFRIYPEVPQEAFGAMSAFSFGVRLPEMCKAATTVVSIRSLPIGKEEESEVRFSIDWHVTSTGRISDLEMARQWLDSTHSTLRSSFDKAFTGECLALFGLSEGE